MADSSFIPTSPDHLTSAWITAALRAGGHLSEEQSVQSVDVSTLASAVEGFSSVLLRLALTFAPADVTTIPNVILAKIALGAEVESSGIAVLLRFYINEVMFFNTLAPHVSEFMREVNASLPTTFFANVDEGGTSAVILMEDLNRRTPKVVPGDEAKGASMQQCMTAMKAIARWHAYTWGKDEKYESDWKWMLPVLHARVPLQEDRLAVIGQLWPRSQYTPFLEELFNTWRVVGDEKCKVWAEGPQVCVHGDFRLDNIFFSEDENSAVLIDFQLIHRGGPVTALTELAYFFVLSMGVEQRREHDKALLREYWQTLLHSGVEGFSFEDCLTAFRASITYVVAFIANMATFPTIRSSERGRAIWAVAAARLEAVVKDYAVMDLLK